MKKVWGMGNGGGNRRGLASTEADRNANSFNCEKKITLKRGTETETERDRDIEPATSRDDYLELNKAHTRGI